MGPFVGVAVNERLADVVTLPVPVLLARDACTPLGFMSPLPGDGRQFVMPLVRDEALVMCPPPGVPSPGWEWRLGLVMLSGDYT